MDSSGKQPGETSSDLDWAVLVKEMEKIKDRVEQTLEPGAAESGSGSPAASSTSSAASEYAPMEEMLSGVGREEIDQDTAAGAKLGPQAKVSNVIPIESVKPAPMPTASTGDVPESALSLAVVGALKLRLELTRQSQTVQIHLEEAQLRVELSDGTQFRIPLNKAA
jgi:hypothetical protein